MSCYQKVFSIKTSKHDEVVDITKEVEKVVQESGAKEGQCTVYTSHATAGVTINENADPNIGTDFLRALSQMVPEHDQWLHDRIDNNAASHIKSALVGPSVTIPISHGNLSLGTWQDIFFCEFDGPRHSRKITVSIVY